MTKKISSKYTSKKRLFVLIAMLLVSTMIFISADRTQAQVGQYVEITFAGHVCQPTYKNTGKYFDYSNGGIRNLRDDVGGYLDVSCPLHVDWDIRSPLSASMTVVDKNINNDIKCTFVSRNPEDGSWTGRYDESEWLSNDGQTLNFSEMTIDEGDYIYMYCKIPNQDTGASSIREITIRGLAKPY